MAAAGAYTLPLWACQEKKSSGQSEKTESMAEKAVESGLMISLAEWSLNKELRNGKMTNLDFPVYTKETYDIHAVEYVNQFFMDKAKDKKYLDELNTICDDNGVKQLLIMIDREGGLAEIDEKVRTQSVENHYKWVEAAKHLGCHSIRVNAYGTGTREETAAAAVDGLGRLSEFAKDFDINIIVENHGGFSSDGQWLSGVAKQINMDNFGTLPDFGNFCVERSDDGCAVEYDKYKGIEELMPFAKAVSAKSHDFDADGNETDKDYERIMNIVKAAGYKGYIGIEYEGSNLSADEGIMATKKLLERYI